MFYEVARYGREGLLASRFRFQASNTTLYLNVDLIDEIYEAVAGSESLPIVVMHLHDTGKDGEAYLTLKAFDDGNKKARTLAASDVAKSVDAVRAGKAQTLTVECVCRDDDESDAPAYAVNWRGPWAAGETYSRLDAVSDPSDETRHYLALAENKSSSKAALLNKSLWCALSPP